MSVDTIIEKHLKKLTPQLKNAGHAGNILDQVLINLYAEISENPEESVVDIKRSDIDLHGGLIQGFEDWKVPGVISKCTIKCKYSIDIPILEISETGSYEKATEVIIKFIDALLHNEDQLEKIVEQTIEYNDECFPHIVDCGGGISASIEYQLHTLDADVVVSHSGNKILVVINITLDLDPESKFHKDLYPWLGSKDHRRYEP